MKTILRHILIIGALLASSPAAMAQADSALTVQADSASMAQPVAPVVPDGSTLTQQAAAAYDSDDFARAIELYHQIEATEGTSSELYYNMGNTYYRLGRMGKAVLYYERSLALNPGNDNARANLEFVNDRLRLITDGGATYFTDTISGLVKSVASNTWAWMGVGCFILMLAAVALYIFSSDVRLRKVGFFGGAALLALTVVANVCAFYTHSSAVNHDYAIITVPSVTLSTSPRAPKDKSEEAFMLNEGMKVEVVDSVATAVSGTWYDVKAENDYRAWVNSEAVDKI